VTDAGTGGFRRGIRLGVDVGTVRVGVARSDPDGVLAVPVSTVARPPRGRRTDLEEIAALVAEYEPLEVVVGLPVTLDGIEGPAAEAVRGYVTDLAAVLLGRGNPVPLRLVDERMSTAEATRGLREAGRTSRTSRAVVDQAAAVIIVQHALDAERSTGHPPGTLVDPGLADPQEDPA
jgi:putative Holliday junction resolvase